ncbi:choice-of-anchor Q domain-containing protein [Dyadobacter sp. CY343]|uniref:choice-of-anchor Q domain-containing protein n=1 Tax=Dyadobacter sp. CY343 TaxID=2907299 RepID=UPI001F18FF63|nr:right-handed parallel beta-helix repeat-containing protein [Dyadobacter sp. CY343]MCE7062325.1 right-handed parallel beta-helix repeat-containing protein [Dyadobacter sp. CY343]
MHSNLLYATSANSLLPARLITFTRLSILFFFIIFSATTFAQGNTWYVTESGGFPQDDGFSWAEASSDLQAIIYKSAPGDQIWVAGGTYRISQFAPGLELKEGVKIYGGFAGNEETLQQRDLRSGENQSVITGEGTHQYTIANVNPNTTGGLTTATVLDGFTITGGSNAGIINYNSSATFSNLYVAGNGSQQGGGVLNNKSASIFVNVTVASNTGAGIGNLESSTRLINCAIINNTSQFGGIFSSKSSTVLINCTVAGANQGGGIANDFESSAKIYNCIVKGTQGGTNGPSATFDIRNSIVDLPPPVFLEMPTQLNIDPLFVDPANGDYRLQPCSPAINTGSNTYYAAGQTPDISAITEDINGQPRFFDNGTVDKGAYEYQNSVEERVPGVWFVRAGATGTGSSWACASGNLQNAINSAASGEQVWVAGGTYLPQPNMPFIMKEGVKIYGGFAGAEVRLADRNLSLTANKSTLNSTGDFVVSNSKLTSAAVLDGFTISGSRIGIANSESSPMLVNLVVTGNGAVGVGNLNSSPTMINCIIAKNTGSNTIVAGVSNSSSSPVLINCTIADNRTATTGGLDLGGGILNNNSSSPKIRNTIIYGNDYGIFTDGTSTSTVEYSIVQLNPTQPGETPTRSVNPLFRDAGAGDYRLQACSPSVNTGFNYFESGQTPDLTGISTDLAGERRVREHIVDMGAYEFSEAFRGLASNLTDVSENITRETVLTASNDACRLVAYILPNGAAPISETVNARVWVADNQPAEFLKRRYQIMPENNALNATARVKLYFSQQEFTDYNEVNEIKLPLNAADAENFKANLRIEKRSGISMDGSGLPGSYTGSISTFKPSQANGSVEWNPVGQYWEVSFDVTGFSGFFVKTKETALPLNLISFTATKESGSNLLKWNTTSEVNTDNFEIQRSSNAKSFLTIATVNAKGSGDHLYSYIDQASDDRTTYYRLKMNDRAANRMDGAYSYSKIISVNGDADFAAVFPNPAGVEITFRVSNALLKTNATLHDISGRKLQTIQISNSKQQLNISSLASGIYVLKFADGTAKTFVKQ